MKATNWIYRYKIFFWHVIVHPWRPALNFLRYLRINHAHWQVLQSSEIAATLQCSKPFKRKLRSFQCLLKKALIFMLRKIKLLSRKLTYSCVHRSSLRTNCVYDVHGLIATLPSVTTLWDSYSYQRVKFSKLFC